jgi:hypothetical protein
MFGGKTPGSIPGSPCHCRHFDQAAQLLRGRMTDMGVMRAVPIRPGCSGWCIALACHRLKDCAAAKLFKPRRPRSVYH